MLQQSTAWLKWYLWDQAIQRVLIRSTNKWPKLPCHLTGLHQCHVLDSHLWSHGSGRASATTRYQGEKNLEFDLWMSRPSLLMWAQSGLLPHQASLQDAPKDRDGCVWAQMMASLHHSWSWLLLRLPVAQTNTEPSIQYHLSRRPASHW